MDSTKGGIGTAQPCQYVHIHRNAKPEPHKVKARVDAEEGRFIKVVWYGVSFRPFSRCHFGPIQPLPSHAPAILGSRGRMKGPEMSIFHGLSAFPITPADEQGRVDTDALRKLLDRLTTARVNSIGLLGSTGSYPYLTRSERRRAIEAAVDQVGGKVPILVGIGALRTDDAIRFGRDAQAAGADAVLLAPVSYTPLTDDEVFAHFEAVAAEVTLPLCVYNNPGTTHFTFSADLIARLSHVPNIVAVKNPAPDAGAVLGHLRELRTKTPEGFSLGYSTDWNATEAMLAGGDAWYSVVGGLFPKLGMEILSAVRAADGSEARRLNARLKPLWDLFTEFSSLRVMYAAVNLLGICRAAPPRPILPLPEAAQRRVGSTLEALELA
jgi:4-hydroxy-tetrahydrodipicolinate synthase